MNIDTALVSKLVHSQFPKWARLPVKPVELDGWDNRTFRLGDRMSVRLPSGQAYSGQVIKEHEWLPILASHLPLSIPVPLALGDPSDDFPWHWSVNRWIEGENVTPDHIDDLNQFATELAHFLNALHQIDIDGGPLPGDHNFFRGGALLTYDTETRNTIAALPGRIDSRVVTAIWETALDSNWQGKPIWVHGDFSTENLLVRKGCLNAVIDFGSMAIGDPACDLTIAWTLLSGKSRESFRAVLPLDEATWQRGRGWALWKGLITFLEYEDSNPDKAQRALNVINEVIADS